MALPDKLLKEKVKEVRQLTPNFSNDNDIILILEHYKYNVEETASAILENGGMDALQSWTQTSKNSVGKLKNKHPKKNFSSNSQTSHKIINSEELHNGKEIDEKHKNSNGIIPVNKSTKNLKTSVPLNPPSSQMSKNLQAGIDKSNKELQRQITSLLHLKIVFEERVERSYKRVNEVFKELQQQLSERQSDLTKMLDESKVLALETLDAYEQKSGDLKIKIGRAQSMKEDEVSDLRSEIKEFVAQRRHFDEVAHSCKFNCDINKILIDIQEFGEVHGVKGIVDNVIPNDMSLEGPAETTDISKRIISQSDSLVKYEAGTMDANLVNKDISSKVFEKKPFKSPARNRSKKKPYKSEKQSNLQESPKRVNPGKQTNMEMK